MGGRRADSSGADGGDAAPLLGDMPGPASLEAAAGRLKPVEDFGGLAFPGRKSRIEGGRERSGSAPTPCTVPGDASARTTVPDRLRHPVQYRVMHLLEPRYRTSTPITSDTLEGLVGQLDIDDRMQALRTLDAYNDAACDPAGFDPTVLDGLATKGDRPSQVEPGAAARRATVRSVPRHRRDHLHLRRVRDRREREGARHGLAPDARAPYLRRDGRRALALQLPRRDRSCLRGGIRSHRGAIGCTFLPSRFPERTLPALNEDTLEDAVSIVSAAWGCRFVLLLAPSSRATEAGEGDPHILPCEVVGHRRAHGIDGVVGDGIRIRMPGR